MVILANKSNLIFSAPRLRPPRPLSRGHTGILRWPIHGPVNLREQPDVGLFGKLVFGAGVGAHFIKYPSNTQVAEIQMPKRRKSLPLSSRSNIGLCSFENRGIISLISSAICRKAGRKSYDAVPRGGISIFGLLHIAARPQKSTFAEIGVVKRPVLSTCSPPIPIGTKEHAKADRRDALCPSPKIQKQAAFGYHTAIPCGCAHSHP